METALHQIIKSKKKALELKEGSLWNNNKENWEFINVSENG